MHVAPYVFPPPSAVLAELAAEPMLFVRARTGHGVRGRAPAGPGRCGGRARVRRRRDCTPAASTRLLTPLVVASQTVPGDRPGASARAVDRATARRREVVVCALIAFFPMAVTAREGLRATDPQLLLLHALRRARAAGTSSGACACPARCPYLAAGATHRRHAEPGRRRRRRVDRRRPRPRLPGAVAPTPAWPPRRRSPPSLVITAARSGSPTAPPCCSSGGSAGGPPAQRRTARRTHMARHPNASA